MAILSVECRFDEPEIRRIVTFEEPVIRRIVFRRIFIARSNLAFLLLFLGLGGTVRTRR